MEMTGMLLIAASLIVISIRGMRQHEKVDCAIAQE
jgi:hypothetical protein